MVFTQQQVLILAYHRVHRDDDPSMPEVSPNQHCGHVTLSVFRKQMAALAHRNFSTVSHEQLARWLYDQVPLPEDKVIAIGFDDNRLNVLENAEPVMREYGFRGTVWTISRLTDGNLPSYQHYPWMNWDHLGQLLNLGWELGAHSATHIMAPQLLRGTSGPDGTKRYVDDLVECNEIIEHNLGIKPEHFSCPGGEWNQQAEAIVLRYYKTARHWICDDRPYRSNIYETNPYRLQAINVSMHTTEDMFSQLIDHPSV